MKKHSMHDCIIKAEKKLRENYSDETITIITENAISWRTNDIVRECALEVESQRKKKNGEYSKTTKKSILWLDYCPFCGAKNR